ncbi:hypothetical protein [Nonomuraea cavernae]|uniref:hypothetical protein n=1 Tax=Nonomuraea cavernae TaxID=2045107 RepID=UPI00166B49ED|nr:hypothetical protein [Nonomuraea cavernae]MCA2188074.1 hypothetical protein [Nonomuraea cavernae]
MGNDEDVHRLRIMAQACRNMRARLLETHDDLVQAEDLLANWRGDSATEFKETHGNLLDPEFRLQAIDQLGEAYKVLETAADVSVRTQKALAELAQSLLIAIVMAAAISSVTAGLASLAAWARSAKTTSEIAVVATTTLGRFRLIFRTLGGLLRNLTTAVGRSRVVRGLGTKAGDEPLTFLQMARGSWKSYWQLYRWGLFGNVAINAVANPFRGRHPLDRSLLSLAEGGNSAIVAGLIGGTGGIAAFAAMNPWKRNLIQGAVAGGGATFWNDRVEGKSWEQTGKEVVFAAALAGGLNVFYVGMGESRFVAGQGSEAWRRYWGDLPPMVKGYVVGYPGNVSMRVAVPWAAKPEPLDMPTFRLPGGPDDPDAD